MTTKKPIVATEHQLEPSKAIEALRKRFENCFDPESPIGFDFHGTWVVNPFYDETLRFEVDPVQYYGTENIEIFLELAN